VGSDGPYESCVIDGSPAVLRDVAMATLFDSRGGFSGSRHPIKTAEIECLRVVSMASNFGTKIAIN